MGYSLANHCFIFAVSDSGPQKLVRLLHIIAGGQHGGAETFFQDLVRSLSGQSLKQHAVTRPYPARLAHLNESACSYSVSRMGGALDFFSAPRIKRATKDYAPDIVLAWMNRAAGYAPRGPWKTVGRLGGYYNLKYYQNCDHLVCNTPYLVSHCIDHGWSKDRVDYIPNFSPVVEVEPVGRDSLGTPATANVLLVLARLEEVKGIDVALKALVDLPGSYLWIAGEGALETDLRALAASLGVIERVRFLGWRDDREALLSAADICLVPSRHEPFGNVVINAWVSGTPVIAASSQGPGFLIEHEQNGLLVPVDDATAMGQAIKTLSADLDLAKRLAAGGQANATGSFSEAAVVKSYLTLFEKLLQNR